MMTAPTKIKRFLVILVLFIVLGSLFLVYLLPSQSYFQDAATIGINTSNLFNLFEKSINNRKPLEKYLTTRAEMHKVKGVNCSGLFMASKKDKRKPKTKSTNTEQPLSDQTYLSLTVNCMDFQQKRWYIMSTLTIEEEEFPIAYSLIVYRDTEMVERLLRAIYRPQNIYCIHVDTKSTATFYSAISGIAKCFTNVFLTSRRIDVKWATFTVLEPEILCMEELWRYKKWKYFINLTGQEFPLKTNFELVKILTAYKGANDVISLLKSAVQGRWNKTLPPYRLLPAQGSVHIVANRHFIDFILHNSTAKALLNWTKTTYVPDETYFATLNSNPQLGIKGMYTGDIDHPNRTFFSRFKMWRKYAYKCPGKYVRNICILTTGDLPALKTSPKMFANKFYLSEDRVVIGCLEEKIFNDTRDEYTGTKTFDDSIYSNAYFVKNQVT